MKRWISFLIAATLVVLLPQVFVESPLYARVVSISGICLLLWITEVVPPFVPTLLLWCLVPFFLAPIDGRFALPNVLAWAADPVLALFFGGFALGVAAGRSGLDARLADLAIRASGTSYRKFLLIIILITAFFSMWISNIAAAALVFGFLAPIISKFDEDHLLRRTLLIGVALGANIGGIATPIGTGSNAMAIAAISPVQPISFLSWMAFAFPLTVGMLLISYLLLIWRTGKGDGEWAKRLAPVFVPRKETLGSGALNRVVFILILTGTAALWLTEPFHGIPSAVVAIGSAAVLFGSRTLGAKDLLRIDWSTLILIAGGITLGRLLE